MSKKLIGSFYPSLQSKQFLLDLNMSTTCKKAPKISLLTFLNEDECDDVWREKLTTDYDRILSKTLQAMSLLQDRLSRSKMVIQATQ